jgi:hypothetical protein
MDAARLPIWEMTEPTRWRLTLTTGSEIELLADAYSESEGFYEFSSLIDTDVEPSAGIRVTGRTPSNPRRMIVTVARLPVAEVSEIETI